MVYLEGTPDLDGALSLVKAMAREAEIAVRRSEEMNTGSDVRAMNNHLRTFLLIAAQIPEICDANMRRTLHNFERALADMSAKSGTDLVFEDWSRPKKVGRPLRTAASAIRAAATRPQTCTRRYRDKYAGLSANEIQTAIERRKRQLADREHKRKDKGPYRTRFNPSR
jgi:hypothetical protein